MSNQVSEDRLWTLVWAIAAAALAAGLSGWKARGVRRKVEALERRNRELETELSVARAAGDETRRQLEHSDRMAVLGMATAHLAHEISSPLLYLMLNLPRTRELIPGNGASMSPEVRSELVEILDDTEEGVRRIERIATELKSFSKRQPGEREHIEVKEAVRSSVAMLGGLLRERARLEEHHEAAPLVAASRVRLVQVVVNLLRNSLEALPPRRITNAVRVTTGTTSTGDAFIRVEDNGPGIPPELLSRVFEPFFTTKPAHVGTGLGLSICREIVHDMGGRIRVESHREHGARFEVTLPSAAAASSQPVRLVASSDPS